MKDKLGAAFLCLAFALPFGAVGAFASWALATMVRDSVRAQDWVRVKADIVGEGYRYTFRGATYSGNRLGVVPFGGSDNVDDFHDRMAELFSRAREQNRPITVYVNPDEPSESMVDRTMRWPFAIFLIPFALAFGGVGVGGLWAFTQVLRTERGRPAEIPIAGPAQGGATGLWIFAFFWNALAFPIAILAVPRMWEEGEWVGLLVLLFPAVGLLLLWGAISATVRRLRGRDTPAVARKAAAPPAPPRAAATAPTLRTIEEMLGGVAPGRTLTADQKATFAALDAEQRQALVRVLRWAPATKNVVIGIVVVLVAMEFLPFIVAAVAALF